MRDHDVLTVRAGGHALQRIRETGLQPGEIALVPGAAGGAKALGIAGLDRAIFGEWLPRSPRVRHLVGASIGAWRFAAACMPDAARSLAEFARLYTAQSYPRGAGPAYVSRSAREMLAELFGGHEGQILSNAAYRLHVLAVRGRGPLQRDSRWGTPLGFGLAALANAAGRRHLARFVDRAVFHDARERPPFGAEAFDAFRTHYVPLGAANFQAALLASASIPLVLQGVADIAEAPEGVYWDGGIADYHLHLPYHHSEGLVLYPHFTDRIVPGWLDKQLPWRRARGAWLANVVLVAPSRQYLARLPRGKLPSRQDFATYAGDDAGRIAYWRTAIAESERLGEAFLALAKDPGRFPIQPL